MFAQDKACCLSSLSCLEGIPVPLRRLIICVHLLTEGCKSASAPGCESAGPSAASPDTRLQRGRGWEPSPAPRSAATAAAPRATWYPGDEQVPNDRFGDSQSSPGLQTPRAAALEHPTCPPSRVCHPSCNQHVLVTHGHGTLWHWVEQAVGAADF